VRFKRQIIQSFLIFGFLASFVHAQKITISGYVQDAASGEKLLYANIFELVLGVGTISNNYGFFSLTLPTTNKDSLTVVVSYIGYERWQKKLPPSKDVWLTVNMNPKVVAGKTVEVVADKYERIEKKSQMSRIDIPIRQIEMVPALLGESDVLKAIQLLPGVQSGVEGSSGLYVRGGGPDQNLILLDGATVYNANHLFGFFSVFNADAIKNVSLTKGGFPARFGGRLSSVLEISMKEGNNQKFTGQATIGLVASRFTYEGPLNKGKSSFIISGRRTYIDVLAKPFLDKNDYGGYYFYDLNAKLNHSFSKNNHLFFSLYTGDDNFYAKQQEEDINGFSSNYDFGLGWGNITSTLRWNHLYNKKLFSNLALTYSNFEFYTEMKSSWKEYGTLMESDRIKYSSGIQDISARIDFDFLPNPRHFIKFGGNVIRHTFNPGVVQFKMSGEDMASIDTLVAPVAKHIAMEASGYIEDDFKLTSALKMNLGIHASLFSVNKKLYSSIEPRVSVRYLLGNWAIKSSYANMTQYIHLLTNSGIGLPTDLWVPATDKVKPQQSKQIGLGIARSLKKGLVELSVEGYYKTMNNLIEYKEGSGFLGLDTDWQNKIEFGEGRSYGVEFFLQKKSGKTTGWLGYTLSWSDRKFEELNFGKRFPFRYDRRHDIALVLNHSISSKIELSCNWIYGTGNAISLGTARYQGAGSLAEPTKSYYHQEITYYNQRNGFRMVAYHRLDIGVRFIGGKNRNRIFSIGIYNAYSRKNPFFYYFDEKEDRRVLKQVSLFPIIPSISYSWKF